MAPPPTPRIRGDRIWTPRFATLFAINFVISFAQFMTLALVPKLAEALGATAVVVGVITGLFAVTALAVRPVVGLATLRVRNNLLLAGTLTLIVVAFLLYGLSSSIPVLIVARLMHGVGMGFLAPVTLAMASDSVPPTRMAQGIGVFSLGQAVATAAGPPIGLLLLGAVGNRSAFLIGAGLLVLAAAAALRVRTPRRREVERTPFGLASVFATEALVPATLMFFLAGAFSGVNAFIVLYGEARGVAQIGLFFTVYAVFILISRPIAGRLGDTYGMAVVILPGLVMFGASLVVISQAHTLVGFLIAAAIAALGYGICQPAVQTLSLMSVSPERRGVASNTNYIGIDLGYLIMPIVAGGLVTTGVDDGRSTADAYGTMYLALTVPIVLGASVYVVSGLARRRRRRAGLPGVLRADA